MEWTVIAVAWPGAASAPLAAWSNEVSLVVALIVTAGVGALAEWQARRRQKQWRAVLAVTPAAGGVH
jgi:hypothetical protein